VSDQLLELKAVCAGYGKKQVLREISFTVEQGGVLALIGPNGAGKTTLAKAILGFLPLMSGSVVFEGTRIEKRSTSQRIQAGLGFVPEGARAFPTLAATSCRPVATSRQRWSGSSSSSRSSVSASGKRHGR
jgi:ABC-type branched-subunit amino acid transport system ATPase component